MLRFALFLALALLAVPRVLSSQAATRPRVIRGRVFAADETPLAGASVSAATDSGTVARVTRTDSSGAYSLELGGEQTYVITVQKFGFHPERRTVSAGTDALRELVVDFRLAPFALTLPTVEVHAQRPTPVFGSEIYAHSPGATDQRLDMTSGLSGDLSGDPDAALGLLPEVTVPPGGGGPSVFGLGSDQNGATLNGSDLGQGSLPRDGLLRTVRLATYDPKVGRFAGAQINTIMTSGTNYVERSLHATVDDPLLQAADAPSRWLGGEYRELILSGTATGPLRADKMFFNSAFQFQRHRSSLATLASVDPKAFDALGINPDSVRRLIATANAVGLPISQPDAPSAVTATGVSGIARVDFTSGAGPLIGTGKPAVYLLASGALSNSAGVGGDPTRSESQLMHSRHQDAQLLLDYAPYLLGALNETKIGVSFQHDRSLGDVALPSASLLLDSPTTAGDRNAVPFLLGGNSTDESLRQWSWQLTNETSWMTMTRAHTFDLYVDLRHEHFTRTSGNNEFGTFVFNSLADFASGTPTSFDRHFGGNQSAGSAWTGTVALGDVYVHGPQARASLLGVADEGLRIQYGLRADFQRFDEQPAYNALVDSVLGARNDHVPNRVALSPMIGFTWKHGTYHTYDGRDVISDTRFAIIGGIREYRSGVRASDVDGVARQNGLPSAVQDLLCVGGATPVPNWSAYATSPANIPSMCAGGAAASSLVQMAPSVSLFAPGFSGVQSWRTALRSRVLLTGSLAATFGGTWTLNRGGVEQYDLNFRPHADFRLSDEDERPVFVSPASISDAGALITTDSRVSPGLAHVTELRSRLQSSQQQLIAGLEYGFGRNHHYLAAIAGTSRFHGSLSLDYAFTNAAVQMSGFSGITTGDPRVIGWLRGPTPTHLLQLALHGQFDGWFSIGLFGRLSSGFAYSPSVAGDINGDGYSNDAAFVFDPNTAGDHDVAAGMTRLLAGAPRGAARCLRAQLDKIAQPNSCRGSWSLSLPVISINLDPYRIGLGYRGALAIYIQNPLGGLDRLLHSPAHLHGWGGSAFPDPTLLTVRGFDHNANRFVYAVNPLFGRTVANRGLGGPPFQLRIDFRVDIGPNREDEYITAQVHRAQAIAEERVLTAAVMKEALLERARLSSDGDFEQLDRLPPLLSLDSVQADSVSVLEHQYVTTRDSIYADLAEFLLTTRRNHDDADVRQQWHESIATSIREKYKIARFVRDLLTSAQMNWLEESGRGAWLEWSPNSLTQILREPLDPR